MKIVSFALILISSLLISVLSARYVSNRFGIGRTKATVLFVAISFIYTVSLLYFFGAAAITLKGLVLLYILMYSSSEDIKTRNCDDCIHLMIVIAALIGTEVNQLPKMLLSGFFVMILMLASVMIGKGSMGGADIKLSSACAFLLGFGKGLVGLLIGLLLAIAVTLIQGKDKKQAFPLIPYLSVGFGLAFFI